jgi:c-di-GMP phosphodiesterase
MNHFKLKTNDTSIPEDMLSNWQEIVDILAKIINVPAGLIMRVKQSHIEVLISSNTKGNPYEVGEKAELSGLYCTTVMKSRSSLLVKDALNDSEWNQNPDIKLGMISYLGFPIEWPNGDIFGTICILDSKSNEYNENYKNLLNRFQQVIEGNLELVFKNHALIEALNQIKNLESILPICASCKKIRTEEDQWIQLESYFRRARGLEFTHGICPVCLQKGLDDISP